MAIFEIAIVFLVFMLAIYGAIALWSDVQQFRKMRNYMTESSNENLRKHVMSVSGKQVEKP